MMYVCISLFFFCCLCANYESPSNTNPTCKTQPKKGKTTNAYCRPQLLRAVRGHVLWAPLFEAVLQTDLCQGVQLCLCLVENGHKHSWGTTAVRTKAVCRHGPSLLLPNHSMLDCTWMFPSHPIHCCTCAWQPCFHARCFIYSLWQDFMGHYWRHCCIPASAFLQLDMKVWELLQALLQLGWDVALSGSPAAVWGW